MGIIRKFTLLLMLFIAVSCGNRQLRETLDDVRNYISERPDSALAVLEGMKADVGDSRRDRAEFALLYSMALDKNYIDLASDSVIAPAVSWYSRHGSADDRLKMCYYRARISDNAQDADSALEWYAKGERLADKCTDFSAVGRLYRGISTIYYKSYHYERSLDNLRVALDYFNRSPGDDITAWVKLDLVAALLCCNEFDEAREALQELIVQTPDLNAEQLKMFYRYDLHLSVVLRKDVEPAIEAVYKNIDSPKDYPFLLMARAYNILGNADSAQFYLNSFGSRDRTSLDYPAYCLAVSDAMALRGEYKAAFEREHEFISEEMNVLHTKIKSEINFIEERENNRLTISKVTYCVMMLAIIVLSLILLSAVLFNALRKYRLNVADQERRVREIQVLYDSLLAERNALQAQIDCLPQPQVRELLGKRLQVLNQFILSSIVKDKRYASDAMDQLKGLIDDREEYMKSTAELISSMYPSFVAHLRAHGLTEYEIEHCCLYASGLNGKNIGIFTNVKRHYMYDVDIRQKLGLDRGTQLSSFIRDFLAEK